MVAGAFFFSLMSLLVKVAGQRLPSQEIVLARSVVMVVLSGWALRAAGISPWGHDRRLLVLRGLLGFGALSAFYYALVHLPLADATVIQYTNPVWATVFAVWALHERFGPREMLPAAASLAGVLLVARPSFLFGDAAARLDPVAVAVGLSGAVFSGAAYVTVRKLGRSEAPLVIVLYFSAISVVCSLPLALPEAVWPTATEWLVLLGIGVTTQFGQIYLTRGLHLERAGKATAIAYLQIVFAALWGILFFREIPDAGTLLGGALIVGGSLVLARRDRPATGR